MDPLSSQIYYFLITVIIGLGVGLIYDLYSELRTYLRVKKTSGHLWDLVFWVVVTIFTYLLLLAGNWGEIRLYVIIGLITGSILYMKILGLVITPAIISVVSMLAKITKMVITIVLYPFRLLTKIVLVPLGFLGLIFTKVNNIMQRILWKFFGKPMNVVVTRSKKNYFRFKQNLINKIIKFLKKQ